MTDSIPGVPLEDLDESTDCPECDERVEIAMTLAFFEASDGTIRVTELGYACPACRADWTVEAAS